MAMKGFTVELPWEVVERIAAIWREKPYAPNVAVTVEDGKVTVKES